MPAATVRTLHIERGATLRKRYTWKAGDAPVDLTGCVARMHIRDHVEAEAPLLVLTTENGRIIITPLAGTIELFLPHTLTRDIEWTEGVFDLEVEHPDGTVTRVLKGKATVSDEVTRE